MGSSQERRTPGGTAVPNVEWPLLFGLLGVSAAVGIGVMRRRIRLSRDGEIRTPDPLLPKHNRANDTLTWQNAGQ